MNGAGIKATSPEKRIKFNNGVCVFSSCWLSVESGKRNCDGGPNTAHSVLYMQEPFRLESSFGIKPSLTFHLEVLSDSNTMTTKKINTTLFVSGVGSDVCNPFFDKAGKLHIIRQNVGTILTVDSVGNTNSIVNTGGQPSYAVYNQEGVMYVADFGHSAILAFTKDGNNELVVGVYEDKPLRGPHSIAIVDDDIFFTDSGAFGDTGLHAPAGSVFAISNSPSGQVLKPLSLGNLAYPSGIAVTKDKRFVCVIVILRVHNLCFDEKSRLLCSGMSLKR